jgi:hypothetical protein
MPARPREGYRVAIVACFAAGLMGSGTKTAYRVWNPLVWFVGSGL